MSRRVIGYIDGRAQWEDLGPSEWVEFGPLGGSAIEPRVKRSPDLPRPARVRDYHASVVKGHATRRLHGMGK